MTLWFYVKTADDPKIVGKAVCDFNYTEGKHPGDKYSWIIEPDYDEPEYLIISGKYAALKDLSEIAVVYRMGDTVAFSQIDDALASNFAEPLITKYGFDNVKWLMAPGKE